MKIRYLPSSPKNGTEEHIRNDVGATLVAAGFAEEVVMPRRGSVGNAWLEARLEQSRLAGPPDIHDVCPADADGTTWGVKTSGKQVLILKKTDGQLFFLNGPPKDCPARIVQQFLDECAKNPEANVLAFEAAKRAQAASEHVEKTAKWGVMFPSKL